MNGSRRKNQGGVGERGIYENVPYFNCVCNFKLGLCKGEG